MPHVAGHTNLPFWLQTDRTPTTSPIEEASGASLASRIPGDYLIEKLVLLSPNVDAEIDLTPTFDTISIFEDISKPYILMDLSIVESYGLRELIPLIGEEFIELVASTAGVVAGEGSPTNSLFDGVIQKVFRVTSMSPIVSTSERVKNYVLHCVSVEAVINEKTRISRGYVKSSIDKVVMDIYEKEFVKPLMNEYSSYVGLSKVKPLVIEPTEGTHDITFPFKKPFDIFDDLAEKALSLNEPEEEDIPFTTASDSVPPAEQTGGALYMFYETLSSFRFESLESVFKREPKRHIYAKPTPMLTPEDLLNGFSNAIDYEIDGLFDIVDNLRAGMYASKLITHDMTRMRYDITGYSYILRDDTPFSAPEPSTGVETETTVGGTEPEASKKKLPDLTLSLARPGASGKLCTNKNDLLHDNDNGERCKIKFMATDLNHGYFFEANRKAAGGGREKGIKESSLERRVQLRDSQLQQLDNIKVTLRMYGDSSLRVGEIINFYAPSQTLQEGKDQEEDVFLSGKYIITKIRHVINAESYMMHVQCRKDAWYSDLPAWDQALSASRKLDGTSKAEAANKMLGVKDAQITTDATSASDTITPGGSGR
jgi:hypothetical protein